MMRVKCARDVVMGVKCTRDVVMGLRCTRDVVIGVKCTMSMVMVLITKAYSGMMLSRVMMVHSSTPWCVITTIHGIIQLIPHCIPHHIIPILNTTVYYHVLPTQRNKRINTGIINTDSNNGHTSVPGLNPKGIPRPNRPQGWSVHTRVPWVSG